MAFIVFTCERVKLAIKDDITCQLNITLLFSGNIWISTSFCNSINNKTVYMIYIIRIKMGVSTKEQVNVETINQRIETSDVDGGLR